MLRSAIFLLLLAAIFAIAQPSEADGWVHLQSSDGIEIYQRYEANGEVSIQAIAILDAPLEDLVPFVEKPENFPLWLAEVSSSSVLEQKPTSKLIHFTLEPASTGVRYDVVAEYFASYIAHNSFTGKLLYHPELSAEQAGFERISAFSGTIQMNATKHPDTDSAATELVLALRVSFDESLTKSQTARELKALVSESMVNLAMKTVSMVIR